MSTTEFLLNFLTTESLGCLNLLQFRFMNYPVYFCNVGLGDMAYLHANNLIQLRNLILTNTKQSRLHNGILALYISLGLYQT